MTTKTIPKAAFDGALKLARKPADVLLGVAPENRITSSIAVAVDRADAAIRGAAGSAMRDLELGDEAKRLRAAAEERRRARDLPTEAGEATAQASEDVTEVKAEQTETKRKQAAKPRPTKADEKVEERSKDERVEVLQSKAEALEEMDAQRKKQSTERGSNGAG